MLQHEIGGPCGWVIISHPDRERLSLATDEGGTLICYDDNGLTPDEARALATALLRAADEAEGRQPGPAPAGPSP